MAGMYDHSIASIFNFIQGVKGDILEAKKKFGCCYLAIIDMGETFEIEVEVSEGTIAGNFTVDSTIEVAREVADKMAALIHNSLGCHVVKTRKEWEEKIAKKRI